MAEDEKRSRPPPPIPSLLAGRSSSADAQQSSRILATLEGRVPEAEAGHLPPRQRSRAPLRVLLVLLLVCLGAGLWAVYDTAELPAVVARIEPDARPAGNPSAEGAAAVATQANPQGNAPASAQARMPADAPAPPPSAAAIIDDHPLAQLTQPADEGEPANPLAALAVTAAEPKPATAPRAAAPKAPGPTTQRAERSREATVIAAATPGAAASTSKSAPARGKATPRNDSDAALLATLMAYGLPPASPPGTKVYKTDGIFVRELPGSSLATRLGECRKLGFLESEQCRLRVCAGHWGTAPECPNAQSHIEP